MRASTDGMQVLLFTAFKGERGNSNQFTKCPIVEVNYSQKNFATIVTLDSKRENKIKPNETKSTVFVTKKINGTLSEWEYYPQIVFFRNK